MSEESVLVELPGGRLYLDDCRIQNFTYGDASVLSLLPKTNDSQKLFELIDRRVNLPVSDLTLQDFWYIMYWQRINSYSSFPVRVPWTCNHCQTKNNDELTGPSLLIEDVDPDYFHGMELDFPDSGPLALRLKLVGDELKAKKYMRKNNINDDDVIFEKLLTACMLEPNGGSLEERYRLVDTMSSDDQFLLKAFESEFDYGVKNYSEFVCENSECREVVKVSYQFDLTNFFPSVQDKSDVRRRILSRKAPSSANRDDKGHGLDESNLHQGNAHKELEDTKRQTRSDESPSQSKKERLEISPEELQAMIDKGVQEATQAADFGSLDDVIKDR